MIFKKKSQFEKKLKKETKKKEVLLHLIFLVITAPLTLKGSWNM